MPNAERRTQNPMYQTGQAAEYCSRSQDDNDNDNADGDGSRVPAAAQLLT